MDDRKPSDNAERIVVRLPDGMRDRLAARAKANGRSANAEAVMALEAWLERDEVIERNLPVTYVATDPSEGVEGFLAAASKFVGKHPGLRITIDLRPEDEAEPVRTLGPDDRLADVGEVEGGPPFPRRVDGDAIPSEEREKIQREFDARQKRMLEANAKRAGRT